MFEMFENFNQDRVFLEDLTKIEIFPNFQKFRPNSKFLKKFV